MSNQILTLLGLSLLIISITGCRKRGVTENPDYSHTLIKKDSVKIQLDARTSFEFQNVHYYENDSLEWLTQVDFNINGLNIFDISTGQLVNQFEVPTAGPGATPNVSGISFINPDSILVFRKMLLSRINIFNANGQYISTISPERVLREREDSKSPAINHQVSTYTPAVIRNNKIYFSRWAIFNFSMASNITNEYPVEFYLDLETLETQKMPVYFPEWMQSAGWNMLYLLHSKTEDKQGNFVYSFQGDDSLTVLDDNLITRRVYAGHSKSKMEEKEPYMGNESREQKVRDVITQTIYWGVLYDKYRDVYYRIADIPIKFLDRHRSMLDTYEKPVSIIVLDNQLNKIGEVDLQLDTYAFYGVFVGKRGLYVPRLNPKYSDFSEDHVTYSVYELFKKNSEIL